MFVNRMRMRDAHDMARMEIVAINVVAALTILYAIFFASTQNLHFHL